MKKVLLILLGAGLALAQHQHPSGPAKPAVLMEGYGRHHHPIASTSEEAQKFFDQGLELVFGFNHDEAVRSFARAAELDRKAAMPHWGMALALGANYNDSAPADERLKKARAEVEKALALSASGPDNERAYEAKWDHLAIQLDQVGAPGPLLDAGCGSGWFTQRFVDRGYTVTAFDFTESGIAAARERVTGDVTWSVSDIASYRADQPSPVVVCIDVLFHIVDDDA